MAHDTKEIFKTPKKVISLKGGGKDNGMGIGNRRYTNPKPCSELSERFIKYQYAQDLVNDIEITKGCRHFVIISGTFIFGDFFEALVVKNNYHVKSLTISTLSLSQENIDSLKNLIVGNFVDELNIIVSDYFYSHERGNLVKYMYDELDHDDKFQLAVAGTHCKICTIETHCGMNIVVHGSANLRSSGNLEQISIEDNKPLLEFNKEIFTNILTKYSTIKKAIRHGKLWDTLNGK
jgi:hypothetical protein